MGPAAHQLEGPGTRQTFLAGDRLPCEAETDVWPMTCLSVPAEYRLLMSVFPLCVNLCVCGSCCLQPSLKDETETEHRERMGNVHQGFVVRSICLLKDGWSPWCMPHRDADTRTHARTHNIHIYTCVPPFHSIQDQVEGRAHKCYVSFK